MNILLLFHAVIPHLTGKFLAEVFPHHFIENLPYNSVQPYHCIPPNCGRLMSHFEMFPPDRLTPRAICPQCWSNMTSIRSDECWVCCDYIEDWRFERQKLKPHDLHFRIHGLRCSDYWSIVSAKALGQDMSFLRDEDHSLTREHPQYIDAQYQEMAPIPINRGHAALPAPNQEGGLYRILRSK